MRRSGPAQMRRANRGAVMTDYGILLATIAIVVLISIFAVGGDIKRIYCEAGSALAQAMGRAPWDCDPVEPKVEDLAAAAEEEALAEKPEDCAEGCLFAGFTTGKVAKLNTEGLPLWENTTLTKKIYEIASDKDGNIYAGGEDGFVLKIGPDGKEIWRGLELGPVMAIAVSDDGFVYTGTGSGHSSVVKYNAETGGVLAIQRVRTPDSYGGPRDWVNGVTVDKHGFVYASTKYGALAKIDPNGEMPILWQEEASQELLEDVDVDDTGNLYVVGSTIDTLQPDAGADEEAFMVVDDGAARYTVNSNTDLAGQFFDAALAPNGDYAVVGFRKWPDGEYGTYVTNMRLGSKSNPNKWTADYHLLPGSVRGINFDKAGDLYVANIGGWIKKLNGKTGEELASWDYPEGIWTVHVSGKPRSKGPSGSTEVAQTVPPVAGPGTCSTNCPYVGLSNGTVIKVGDNGSPVWTSTDSKSQISGMQWMADGSLLTGSTDGKLRKFDPDGNVVWVHDSGVASVTDVVVIADGHIIFGATGGMVRKLTPDGETVATRYVETTISDKAKNDFVKSLALGPTGDVFAASQHGAFARINPDGDMTVLWREEMGIEYLDRLEVGNDGLIYVTTYQYDSSQADRNIYDMVWVFREAGNARQLVTFQDEPNGYISASALNKSNNTFAFAEWTYSGGFKPIIRSINPGADYPKMWSKATMFTNVVQDMSFNKDYSILYAGGSDNTLRKINPANGTELGKYTFSTRVMSVEIGH